MATRPWTLGPSMDSARLIAEFLNYLRVEKRLSANTVAAYGRDLRRYAAFLERRGRGMPEATRIDVQEYLAVLYRAKLDSRSIARHLVTLRGFYRQLLIDGVLSEDPTLNLQSPRTWKTLPKSLSAEDVEKLLGAPDAATPEGVRDRAMPRVALFDRLARFRVGDVARRRFARRDGLRAGDRKGQQAAPGARG